MLPYDEKIPAHGQFRACGKVDAAPTLLFAIESVFERVSYF